MVGLCTLILWGTDGGSMYADIMGDSWWVYVR